VWGWRSTGDQGADPPQRRTWSPSRRALLTVATLIVLLGAGGFAGWNASRTSPARVAVPVTTGGPWPTSRVIDPQRPRLAQAPPSPQPVGYTVVARMKGTFFGYTRPGGSVKAKVDVTWETMPSALPVIGTAPGGWLDVELPERPDGSTAWIRASDALLASTPYRIVVNVKTTHLQLYKLDEMVLDVPAGVGAPSTPTPLGRYFVAFLEPPISAEYGAFIMITSAHSQAIQSWEGTGDAIIAIHGPIGADAEIGTTGAHISNGCIRLHDNDLLRLEDVPPGTPIDIID
jgi:lipoprotein-anchoring transpeptidase ErfK/SrfK